jgi:type IV pilus assembly protein PilB
MAVFSSNTASQTDSAKPVRVGDMLLEKGILSSEELEQALAYQKDRGHEKLLGEVLVELDMVTQEQIMEVLAAAYQVPYARVSQQIADPKTMEVLPRDFMEEQCVLPMFLVAGKLTLAVHEPANVFLVEEVERLTGHSVQIVAAPLKDIQATLQAHLPSDNVFVINDLVDELKEEGLGLYESHVAT